jgi:hypothetical protein
MYGKRTMLLFFGLYSCKRNNLSPVLSLVFLLSFLQSSLDPGWLKAQQLQRRFFASSLLSLVHILCKLQAPFFPD